MRKNRLSHLSHEAGAALLLLLAFLSCTYLLQAFLFSRMYFEFHLLYDYFRYIRDLLLLRTGYTADGVRVSLFVYPGLLNSLSLLLPTIVFSFGFSFIIARAVYIYNLKIIWSLLSILSSWFTLLPVFWLGLFFLAFAVTSGWFPAGGVESHFAADIGTLGHILNRLYHLILPFFSLALPMTVHLSVLAKQRADSEHNKSAVRSFISQGMNRKEIFKVQISKPLLQELLLQTGSYLPMLVSMLVLVERVFVFSGIGTLAVGAYQSSGIVRPAHSAEVTQAALAYLGVITIILQYSIRAIRGQLYPDSNPLRTKSSRSSLLLLLTVIIAGQILSLANDQYWISTSKTNKLPEQILLLTIALIWTVSIFYRSRQSSRDYSVKTVTIRRTTGCIRAKGFQSIKSTPPIYLVSVVFILILCISAWFVPTQVALRPLVRGTGSQTISVWASLWQRGSIFGQSIIAARFLVFPLIAAVTGSVLGAALGVIQGMYGKREIETGVRFFEMFPSVILIIMASALFSHSILGLLIPLSVIASLRMYRVISWEVQQIRDMEYMEYSRMLGASLPALVTSHVLPQLHVIWKKNSIRIFCEITIIETNMSFLARLYSLSPASARYIPIEGWGVLMRDARYQFIRGQWLDILVPAMVFLTFLGALRILSEGSDSRRSRV